MKRFVAVIIAVSIVVSVVAVPAMAQKQNKGAKRAARAAQRAQVAPGGAGGGGMQDPQGAYGGQPKALPGSGGVPVDSVALLGAGTVLVRGGVLAHRAVRRR